MLVTDADMTFWVLRRPHKGRAGGGKIYMTYRNVACWLAHEATSYQRYEDGHGHLVGLSTVYSAGADLENCGFERVADVASVVPGPLPTKELAVAREHIDSIYGRRKQV